MEQLPQQLANPVAILKSYTQPNSMVIITEMIDADNRPVIVPIHLDKNGNIGISNEVASAYGRSGYSQFINQSRKDGMVLYENKNKGLASLPADGLQLSAVEATTDPIFNIYDFNRNYNTNSENSENVLPTATDSIKQTVENNVLPKAVEEISTKTEVMLYADYSSALEKYGVGGTPNAWVDMTEAWLYDKDAVKNKT